MRHFCLQRIRFLSGDKSQRGYIALISIFTVSALMVLVISSANLISIGEANMGLKESQTWEVFYLTTACAEKALIRLKNDSKYNGNENLTFDNGTCTILSIRGGGNKNRVVRVSGSAYNIIRRIEIEIDELNPDTLIGSWQEVVSF